MTTSKKRFAATLLLLVVGIAVAWAGSSRAQVIVLNEILHDVPPGPEGDANGDGFRHYSEDEFIEIVNPWLERTIDLSGGWVEDNVRARHEFPAGTILGPGEALVVFGGGNPTGGFGGARVQVASTGRLNLGSTDFVIVYDAEGRVRGYFSWPNNAFDESIVLVPEAVPGFTYQPHSEVGDGRYSPGTTRNGGGFSASLQVPVQASSFGAIKALFD